MKAQYTRLFSDSDGESHFEDVEIDLQAVDFAPPAPPLLLSEFRNAVRTGFLGGPSGWTGEWHVSQTRNLFVVISGGWEIEASDGTRREFLPNSVLLVEDTHGKGHNSRVISAEDSLAFLVELGD